MSALTIFIIFVVALLLTIPISLTLALVSVLPGLFDSTFPASGELVMRSMINGVSSFPLLAVPMFILSGIIMARGGISKKLFDFFAYFVGNKRAGLPIAVIITCLFYGAISGSGPATVAAVGSMTIPILTSLGYSLVFATSIVAVAGGLGVIIPPSIPFIFYGMSSGTSVGHLFIAGILPGILIGLCLMIYAYYYCVKHGEDREKLMENYNELRKHGLWSVFKVSFWALLSPIIILGSIYAGIASPTEAATISVYYSLAISLFIYKTLKINEIWKLFVDSVKTYAPIMFIIAAAMGFARVLTFMQVPQTVAELITGTFESKFAVILVINIFLLFVGMVMDTTPAILVLTPILLPIATAVGFNPIHFGVIMVVNLAIGFVTPPIGINLFVASSMSGVPVMTIAKAAMPFIIAFLFALIIIVAVPWISLVLI